jgi:hypothetical protein
MMTSAPPGRCTKNPARPRLVLGTDCQTAAPVATYPGAGRSRENLINGNPQSGLAANPVRS